MGSTAGGTPTKRNSAVVRSTRSYRSTFGWCRSGLAEDAVQVGATDRADGLGHAGALVVHLDLALGLALLLALHAVELAAPVSARRLS